MSAGNGPVDVDARLAGHQDGRGDDAGLLVAELAALAGVRVQAAHGDARLGHAEPLAQGPVGQVDRVEHAADGELVADLEQRLVDGRQHDLKLRGDEHHRHVAGLELLGQQLGVAGILAVARPAPRRSWRSAR